MMCSPLFKSQTSLTQHTTVLSPTLQQIPPWIYIQKHLPSPTSSVFLGFDMFSPLFTQPKLFQALTDSCGIQQNRRRAACHGQPEHLTASQAAGAWSTRVSRLVTLCPRAPRTPRGGNPCQHAAAAAAACWVQLIHPSSSLGSQLIEGNSQHPLLISLFLKQAQSGSHH